MSAASATDDFVRHRNLLFTVAYELLGSAADAEDVLQETWLRWAQVDHGGVRDPRAYLVRTRSRRSGSPRSRRGRRRRADRLGLHRDAPRAGDPGADRAGGLRAPRGLRPRVRRDRGRRREVGGAGTGDLQQLLDLLAPDVVLVSDGGGRVQAALRPIVGVEKVLRFLAAVTPGGLELRPVWANGAPALAFVVDGEVTGVGTMLVEGGLVTALYVVRNPDKLAALDEPSVLTR